MKGPLEGKLYHGAALYPELWDADVLAEDIALMKQAGINVVRMGEFIWSRLEPEENRIDIRFLAEIIQTLHENEIETILCTPTATPPIWLSHGHPERLFVNEKGETLGHGSRQHACTNNPYYRGRSAIIIERLAQELGGLPGLIGWQLDNEFKAHVAECMCAACLEQWHNWLEQRYETIEQLNEAWGTHIWSEYYNRFDQIPQPGATPFLHHASLQTMYRLFSMEKLAEFAEEQIAVIRRYSALPITHNSSIAFHVDIERLFQQLDFGSYDTYASSINWPAYLINCDLWRNVKRGKPFWVMETSASYSGSLESYATPHPAGYVKVEAVAAYALGAGGFCYWPWRQQRAGSEQPHGSVVSAWGKKTIGYAHVMQVEQARRELEEILLTTSPMQAELAMTYSDRAKAYLRTEPLRKLNYRGLVTDFYARLVALGIHRDLITEGSGLGGYKLLLTPFVPYLSPDYLDRALAFVRDGGIWIVGPLTGGRTEHHTWHTDAALGKLEERAGVETTFVYPMDGTDAYGQAFGLQAPLGMWSSVFEPLDGNGLAGASAADSDHQATAIGCVHSGLTPGAAFITERRISQGKLVMLGSMPQGDDGDALLRRMLLHYADEAGVTLRFEATEGTIVAPRQGDGYVIWVIINMDGAGGHVTLPQDGVDALSGAAVPAGSLPVGQYEYRVVRFTK
ncbi:beta-galactosidase [Paenibacillus sp. FSL H8-0537]|uniref:beta-galactosidase n=1 Tax=Paenibacillus sp. FSL H8-0537 TaxID=2921399 RepID=UPI00310181BB